MTVGLFMQRRETNTNNKNNPNDKGINGDSNNNNSIGKTMVTVTSP